MRLPSFTRRLVPATFIVLALAAPSAVRSASITVAPGSLFGYVPLNVFGGNTVVAAGDETIGNLSVPSFVFAGETWNQVGLVSNGYVVVGGGTGADVSNVNTALPNPASPNNVLAPFWTDLDFTLGGSLLTNVLTDGVNSWFVSEWNSVPLKGHPAQVNTFQVWIGVNGVEDITYEYDVLSTPGLLTVGAEDKTGTVGDTYFFNGVGIRPVRGTELRVTSSGLPVVVNAVPEPDTLALLLAGGGIAGVGAVVRRPRRR